MTLTSTELSPLVPDLIHDLIHPPIHPPTGKGVSTDHKSPNIFKLFQDLFHFSYFT